MSSNDNSLGSPTGNGALITQNPPSGATADHHAAGSPGHVDSLDAQLTPARIVSELDRYIIGQQEAKRAVAIALRNRWRRRQLEEPLRSEIVPKNILMIGPTGCGKTEIARRLAKLANAPLLKVEATRFTEVGYVGRDVEQIIRDLTEQAVQMDLNTQKEALADTAQRSAEDRILSAMLGANPSRETREKTRTLLRQGDLDSHEVEVEVSENPGNVLGGLDIPGMPGMQMGIMDLKENLGRMFGKEQTRKQKTTVSEARRLLFDDEIEKHLDRDKAAHRAIRLTEERGIVFLDEIDKVASRRDVRGGDVSREGVQRDLLPLIEGASVQTRHGTVNTNHILFIASGAFHHAKPSDLMPELQGRLPIRVSLNALTESDFLRILKEPENNLPRQYASMLGTEGVTVTFTDAALARIANLTTSINATLENIGARRLHTLMERLLEDLSFNAGNATDDYPTQVTIDESMVNDRLSSLGQDTDLSRYIL